MLSLEQLQEVAQAVKPLQTLCDDDIAAMDVNHNRMRVQLWGGGKILLLALVDSGHSYDVHTGDWDHSTWYHLHVLVDGVWFWDAVDAEIGRRLLDAQNEKAQAAATA